MKPQPPDDSSAGRWAARGRAWPYLIHGLTAVMAILYTVDVVRHHRRLDPWLAAMEIHSPLAKILLLATPLLLLGVVWWRVWKGLR